MDGRVVIL
jgi:serine/threonine protein kinase